MKINQLSLSNFGNIGNAKLNFSNGLNLFSGDNGSGKSTILQAISLHLFNFTTRNLEDYISWDSLSFETEIEFDHQGKHFKQKIAYSKKSSSRELYIDDEFYKNSDATKMLATYFDPKLSLSSAISFEGEIDLIQVKPAQRREYLKKIYDLDFAEGLKDLDLQQSTLENNDLLDVEKKIYLIENTKYDYKPLLTLSLTTEKRSDYQVKLINLQSQKNNYDSQLALYKSNVKSHSFLYQQIQSSEDELQKLSNTILSLDENANFILKENEIAMLDDQISNIKLNRLKAFDISLLQEKYKKKTLLEKDLLDCVHDLELCREGKCPTCGKEFTIDDIGLYETDKENIYLALESIGLEITELEKEQKISKEREEEENRKKQKLELLKNDKINKIKLLEKEKDYYNKERDRLLSNIESLKIKISNFRNEIISLSKFLEENKEPSLDSSIIQEINSIQSLILEYDRTITLNEKIVKDNEELHSQEEKNKINLSTYRDQKDSIIDEIETIKKCKVILQKEFPNYVISNMIKSLENDCNDFIYKAYNGRYKLKIQEKKDSLVIVYGDKDKEVSSASGYEKQLFSLAWKFALGKLQNLGIVILDEVDAQATDENSEKLFDIIGSMKDIYQQIFIITHRENTKEVLLNNYNSKVFEAKDKTILTIN